MKKLTICVALCATALATPAVAQKYNLTLAGASPGGLWSTIGAGIDAAIAAAYPGSTVTYQTSSGGLANAALVSRGSVPMGLINDMELKVAVDGKAPFKQPLKDLRMLFRAYHAGSRFQATHVLANKDAMAKFGITSLADLAKKKPSIRIVVNRPGNLDGDLGLAILEGFKVTQKNISSWGGQVVRAASREYTSLILDRRIDLGIIGLAYKHPRIQEIASGIDPVLMDVTDKVAKAVTAEMGGEPCTIKAGEYPYLKQDITSVCVGVVAVASSKMDPQLAYNFTKAMFEHMEKFRAAHRLLKQEVTLRTMAQPGDAPFHPGAAKYLREKGFLK